jgi:mono/diheme cytochrome c family protein
MTAPAWATTPASVLGALFMAASASLSCGQLPAPDLERMRDQPSLRPFEASALFADGRAMRTPPSGTIARGAALPAAGTPGVVGGHYLAEMPRPPDRAQLERGRDRFTLFCAPCHGPRGDGRSPVATAMSLRRPPSLVDPPVTAFPAGRIFQVATLGYGLMPGYAAELSDDDRWAVVAYLRALGRSQRAQLASLPPALRARAEGALR